MAEELKQDGDKSGKSCCSSGCGCCGGKALKALILLLVGGVLGYLVGGHCAYRKGMCPISNTMMTAPANPPQK